VGAWTVVWSSCALCVAAVLVSGLGNVEGLFDTLRLGLEERALESRVDPAIVMTPADALGAEILPVAESLLAWSVGLAVLGLVTLVAGLSLARGSERGRRVVRASLLLAALACVVGAAGVESPFPGGYDAWGERVEVAVLDAARVTGDPVDRGLLDARPSRATLHWSAWALAALTAIPALLLLRVAGRRDVRDWCAARSRRRPSGADPAARATSEGVAPTPDLR